MLRIGGFTFNDSDADEYKQQNYADEKYAQKCVSNAFRCQEVCQQIALLSVDFHRFYSYEFQEDFTNKIYNVTDALLKNV